MSDGAGNIFLSDDLDLLDYETPIYKQAFQVNRGVALRYMQRTRKYAIMENWKKDEGQFESLKKEIESHYKKLSKDVQKQLTTKLSDLRLALTKGESRRIQACAKSVYGILTQNEVSLPKDKQQLLHHTMHDIGSQSGQDMNVSGKGLSSSSDTGPGAPGMMQKRSTAQSLTESKVNISVEPLKARDLQSQRSPKVTRSTQDTNERKQDNNEKFSSTINVRQGNGPESTKGETRNTDESKDDGDGIDKMKNKLMKLQSENTELLQYKERDGIHQSKREEDAQRIKELETEINNTRSELQRLTEDKKTMQLDIKELQNYSDDMSAKYQSLQNNANEDKKAYKSHFTKLTDDLRDTTEKLDSLKREHEDLSTRYSQLASERLKHGNPDIVDLSDPNRAMKLAERFNDLYNDTWTDAFVAQQGMSISDKSGIGYLLDVLQACYKYCEEVARDQFESLTNVLLHPCQDPRQPVKKNSGLGQPRISTASKKVLRDLRREIMTQSIEEIIQAFLSHMHKQMKTDQDRKRMEVCKTYYQKCVELCWLVVLHDPPLYMKTDVKPGSKVDLNYFSVMSKGDKVDFLVWPALLNGAGGGLLSKGVVETVQSAKKKGGK